MRLERYQADDMRKAMALARAELGEEAVIVTSRSVGGRSEILAATDFDPARLDEAMEKLVKRQANAGRSSVRQSFDWSRLDSLDEEDKKHREVPSLAEIQDELGRLRKLFEGELAQLAWREKGSRQPFRQALVSRLEACGISRELAGRMTNKLPPCKDLEEAWQAQLDFIQRLIRPAPMPLLEEGGVIVLLGMTGVGKTTTAAKIAARFAERHGSREVAFITADERWTGSAEKLISFGSSLGIPVHEVRNSSELQKSLESFSQRRLVIIDTAGYSRGHPQLLSLFDRAVIEKYRLRFHVVLPATAMEEVCLESIHALQGMPLTAAIITKLDESTSIGPVLSVMVRERLPAAFIGTGQKIPDDLQEARAKMFTSAIARSFERARLNRLAQREKQGRNGKAKS